jgi:Pyruvate/2-oxoacid:ferredoxin oxidoreductase delta subunit
MAERGGTFPGMDIPEFYEMAAELFTPAEAAVINALPRGLNPAGSIAAALGEKEDAVVPILEQMADKGLLFSLKKGDRTLYSGLPFVPGIFEYQFMRGTDTPRDRTLARLITAYKSAVNRHRKPERKDFPVYRVIPVNRTIEAQTRIHTYDQVKSYIENSETLAASTCYCRHQAKLIDENSHCGKPDDVCLQLGWGAEFVIDRGLGRKITRQEAFEILDRSEEAGLVHCTNNRQEIDFLCNCCPCHCIILQGALAHPLPGRALNSGFQPGWIAERCTACETCIERCPMEALQMGTEEIPVVDLDRCIGCGVCATGCPEKATEMRSRPDIPAPPSDRRALKESIQKSAGHKDG